MDLKHSTTEQLLSLLKRRNVPQEALDLLRDNGIDGSTLLLLRDDIDKFMAVVPKSGHRLLIKRIIIEDLARADLHVDQAQEVTDLQEQPSDVMWRLETQQAIACAPEETKQVMDLTTALEDDAWFEMSQPINPEESSSEAEKEKKNIQKNYDQEVTDLQEQPSDVMRRLETQQAIACAPEETKQVMDLTTALEDDAWFEMSQPINPEESSSEKKAIMKGKKEEKHTDKQSKIAFFCGNPMVERIMGIIHIYKNNEMTSLSKGVKRSEIICILSVPAKMTCIDLMRFVSPSEEFIECVKIIGDLTPNQYMALLKFWNQELADDFYNRFNGQPYNLIEEEVCHLVYVAKVETMNPSEGGSLPCVGLTELPKCRVCSKRMDESVEGVLIILCNHSFHWSCLSKWPDTLCPLCRYWQTPQPDGNKCFECDSKKNVPESSSITTEDKKIILNAYSTQKSLWMCLICGHIGCSRELPSHAKRHFQETQHTYSLELGTQRVWDYSGDNFVHRLIQKKTDGKLVEYGLGQEYTYLLTSQLENQRHYFQEKITQIEKDSAEQVSSMEKQSQKTLEEYKKLELKLAEAEKENKNIQKNYDQLNKSLQENQKLFQEQLKQSEDKIQSLEATKKQVSSMEEQSQKTLEEYKKLEKEKKKIEKKCKQLNKSLQENQKLLQKQLKQSEDKIESLEATKKQEVADLQEQLADLMRHLETQQAIACAPAETRQELQDGQIILGEGPSTTQQTRKKQTRKTRRKK
ncbi:BRCA1-associated protein-like isoform X2 [Montipora foliosa]|uniref:BRCA1-associated protein-like isoform X2 n=1 Tax=Montipora foliosa TaxID=591990 RepID=UPI0035F13C0A